MATKQDIDLAKRLLGAGVLAEDVVRSALAIQESYRQQGKAVALERVFYARKDLPQGSLGPALAPPLLETQPFTNYRLDAFLDEGGLASVYAARYTPNDTPVAVKVLDPVKALRDVHLQRFQHEARLHIELEHENIVAGYEMGEEGGYHFYTMDLVDGATVLDVIDRRGRLTNEEAMSITVQAARALHHIHEAGFIHRDVKPGNLMVRADGTALLLDLGLVGVMPREGVEPEAASILTVGTVEYLSPEQARGRADLDARADIYSLGMTLYHMVVGEVAFQGESDYEVMAQQILSSMDTQKIKTRRIDPEIHYLITKMAAKDRDERWASMEDAIAVIEGYLPQGLVPLDLGPEPEPDPEAAPAPGPAAPRPGGAPTRGRRKARGDNGGGAPRRTRRRPR